MTARRIEVDPERPDPAIIREAARVLRTGGLVAFPTETVYGLGANALDATAVARIYEAKGRPDYNPLIVHTADRLSARALALHWPPTAEALADAFWPGPLTLVVRKDARVPDIVTAGRPTVGLRVPAHPVALALLRECGSPLAAPSANPFMGVSPTLADHVAAGLGDRVDLILDAGPTPLGIESAVIDVSGDTPVLLRPGTISPARLREVAATLHDPPPDPVGDAPRASPGLTPRHYAPAARLLRFSARDLATAREEASRERSVGGQVGVITLSAPDLGPVIQIVAPLQPGAYARQLYGWLHLLDQQQCTLVLIEDVPDAPEWTGIRDRLQRAATPA
jgi:L-threonylcarbamoyladenylate synthase